MQISRRTALTIMPLAASAFLLACDRGQSAKASAEPVSEAAAVTTVGVTPVVRKPLSRQLTVSSELVPFQEIDVYAKESGYVRELLVDYGTRVKKGQLMAVLDVPELQMTVQQDVAGIKSASEQVTHAEHELKRIEAQHQVLHLQFSRLKGVLDSRPGLVAQQEVDDAQGRDLASEAQVEATRSTLDTAQSQLDMAKAREQRDQVLLDYSRITAPFAGVVTQRYANYGTLLQAGTSSSTQAMPLVKLSQDDLFRLVIPVPESYVKYIRVGDPVQVRVPAVDRVFPGKVARFSVDVTADTRTMHTEVDVQNPSRALIPGVYAEATLSLERRNDALVVPLQAVNHTGDQASILLVDPDNTLQERKITLGIETASEAEVRSGLNEGDRIVVSDRSGLKPGARVRPQQVELLQFQAEK